MHFINGELVTGYLVSHYIGATDFDHQLTNR